MWVDSARGDPLAEYRTLLLYVWYPAAPTKGARPAEYFPNFSAMEQGLGVSAMQDELKAAYPGVKSGQIIPHAFATPPVARAHDPFPVLVFSHGFGETSLTYSALLEDLASVGYVVIAIEHPHDSFGILFPDGQVVPLPRPPGTPPCLNRRVR